MKNHRRLFIKRTASLATSASLAGMGLGKAVPAQDIVPKKLTTLVKDGGMELSLSIPSYDSPRIAMAKQMDVFGAVYGMRNIGDSKPYDPPLLGEKTKLGLEGRDEEISNFITYMKNLKQYGGVDIICYNWMPVVSWFRTKMDTVGRGGALMTSFDYEDARMMPVTQYGEISKATLWTTLEYFLKAVVPEAEKIGMNLSLHPDDPQVDKLKGISRIMTSVENFDRMLKLVPSKYSGLTLCQGNFSLMGADIPSLVKRWGKAGKINYVHFRNVR